MSTTDLPPEILSLPMEDRISLAMAIWDSVAEESRELSEDEKQVLNQRLDEHLANPQDARPWDKVYAELKKQL